MVLENPPLKLWVFFHNAHDCVCIDGMHTDVCVNIVQIDETADIYGFLAETVGAVWTWTELFYMYHYEWLYYINGSSFI